MFCLVSTKTYALLEAQYWLLTSLIGCWPYSWLPFISLDLTVHGGREAKGPPVPTGGRQGGGEWPGPHSVVPCYLLLNQARYRSGLIKKESPKSCNTLCSKYATGLKLEKKKKKGEETRDSGGREQERKKTDIPHDFYVVVVRVSGEKKKNLFRGSYL